MYPSSHYSSPYYRNTLSFPNDRCFSSSSRHIDASPSTIHVRRSLLRPPVSLAGSSFLSDQNTSYRSSSFNHYTPALSCAPDEVFLASSSPLYSHMSTHRSNIASRSLLQPPVSLDGSSFWSERATTTTTTSDHCRPQPQSNPLQCFLNRTEPHCPSHLTGSEQTRSLKNDRTGQLNHQLLSDLSKFHCPVEHYGLPIHIHRRTSESTIISILQQLQNVTLYTIDTTLDYPTKPHLQVLPSLIQIQAIHSQTLSTILLIEVQFLPNPSSSLFQLIRNLCSFIFSSDHTIMGWGNVITELQSFQSFNLFDLSQLTNNINIQEIFQDQWNQSHPHIPACPNYSLSSSLNPEFDDCLICYVDSNDLDNVVRGTNNTNNHPICTCPDDHRPYKLDSDAWSLQKAIERSFHLVLDKSTTSNVWSFGLDAILKTRGTSGNQSTREKLISSALHDLFACTNLFFHLGLSSFSPYSSNLTPNLNMLFTTPTTKLPFYFVLSDSHATYVPSSIKTSSHHIAIKYISGLSWLAPHDHPRSATHQIQTPTISSCISSAASIMLLIGTNSVRILNAAQIINQIRDFIILLRTHHPHLVHKTSIIVVAAFPCRKLSCSFPSYSSLQQNIHDYNVRLLELADSLNFSVLDFKITEQHLSTDNIHLHKHHQDLVKDPITNYFDKITSKPLSLPIKINHRSTEAVARRNKRRHQKFDEKHKNFHLNRSISPPWTLTPIKQFLQQQHIPPFKLPPIYRNHLRIQFTNIDSLQSADNLLPHDTFSRDNFFRYFSY